MVASQLLERLPGNVTDVFARVIGKAPDEVFDKQWNIVHSLAQRRNGDRKHVQSEKQVLAEGSGRYRGRQVEIGCCDDPNIDGDRMVTPHPLKFLFLQYPQERDLRFHGEITDFIQKERATVSGFKPAHSPLECPGEGSLLVPEKLGSDQRFWNRRTVDADEWSVLALRPPMQCTRDQLLAGSGFTQNEDCRI